MEEGWGTHASGEFGWIRPTYFLRVSELTVAKLEELAASPTPWVGITMYTGTLDPPENTTLHTVDPAAWAWLAARKWFVSVNDGCTGRSDASGWPHWLEDLLEVQQLSTMPSWMFVNASAEKDLLPPFTDPPSSRWNTSGGGTYAYGGGGGTGWGIAVGSS